MASGKAARVQLSDDEVDDILYLARTNESAELQEYLGQLSQQHSCSIAALLESSVDEDNGNTPFHYCAANGYAGTHILEGEEDRKRFRLLNMRYRSSQNTFITTRALNEN